MWYVIQVRCGDEEKIRRQCEILIPDSILNRGFIPTFEERRKFRGNWITKERKLFPGYVFLSICRVNPRSIHETDKPIGEYRG